MTIKQGQAIKKARTDAGFTQEQLARKVRGITASDISKAERGEKDLTVEQMKTIAKACGVTQTSIIDAGKRKTTSTTSSSTTTSSTAKKTSMLLTATEKTLINNYRKADSKTQKQVQTLLKGKSSSAIDLGNIAQDILGNMVDSLMGKKEGPVTREGFENIEVIEGDNEE